MRNEIRFSGFGGQGIILMGYITGKAAAIYEDKNATLTQSYGPEARGGACSAQVIISDMMISYPLLTAPDVLITMSQAAYNRFRPGLKPGGILIYDSLLVTPAHQEDATSFSIPANSVAIDIGRQIIANIVMLGFMTRICKMVSREAMEHTIRTSIAMPDLNIEAFRRGYEYLYPGSGLIEEVLPDQS